MDRNIITIKYLQSYIKSKEFNSKQIKAYFLEEVVEIEK